MTASDTAELRLPAGGLATTAFEEHMLKDDRPSHPMVIVARFEFTGRPPVDALTTAFDAVVRQEPLLTARVDQPAWGRPRWMPGPIPSLHHVSCSQPRGLQTVSVPRLDPQSGPLIHAEIVDHEGGWSIVLAVHHAACDGLGLVAFMERWLLATVGLEGRRRRASHEVLACLRARGRIATTWNEFLRMLPDLRVGIAGIRQFVSRRVVGLGGQAVAAPDNGDGPWRPTIVVTEVDPAVYSVVEARARAVDVMVNDVLAAAFLAAIVDAAQEAGHPATGNEWVRLSVPVSLRTKSDHLLPAANRVSMVFLDRQRDHCNDPLKLVTGVHAEMELIRSHGLGHIMPLSLELGRLMPGGLARTAKRPQTQATAVLSNLGRCFHRSPLLDSLGTLRIGESALEGWWVVPPVRPGTAFAVATHETGGRRTVAAHVDAAALEPAAASRILARFADRLRDFMSLGVETAGITPEVTAP